jgi:hypothetical protein
MLESLKKENIELKNGLTSSMIHFTNEIDELKKGLL